MNLFIKNTLNLILIWIIFISMIIVWVYLWNSYINIDTIKDNDLLVINKIEEKIVIPYTYTYNVNNKLIDYEKDSNWTIIIKDSLQKNIEKQYTNTFDKKDKLYDMFYFVKNKKPYDINLKEMGKYNFLDLLDIFSTAPYYDTKLNTLYIFSHSSWKLFNPWKDFIEHMNEGDELDFIDNDSWKIDTYIINKREIVHKDKFNNNIFLTVKNQIVLITCYPLNSTQKRLLLYLDKK